MLYCSLNYQLYQGFVTLGEFFLNKTNISIPFDPPPAPPYLENKLYNWLSLFIKDKNTKSQFLFSWTAQSGKH